MIVLSHRGLWMTAAEKNSTAALARSFHQGFGTEADLRDHNCQVVVAHDLPTNDALPAEVLFGVYRGLGSELPLALNIKADGLQQALLSLLQKYDVTNCFVFDMSVPDALGWLRVGVPVFTRHSEVEPEPAYYERAAGIWLDGFFGDWWDEAAIGRHLDAGKRVCVVSPELHGREPRLAWDKLLTFADDSRVMLCTDRPVEARDYVRG